MREAVEEVGVDPAQVELLGRLDEAWSKAGNHVIPVVAWYAGEPAALHPASGEVARIFLTPLAAIAPSTAHRTHRLEVEGHVFENDVIDGPDCEIYGLTADLVLDLVAWLDRPRARPCPHARRRPGPRRPLARPASSLTAGARPRGVPGFRRRDSGGRDMRLRTLVLAAVVALVASACAWSQPGGSAARNSANPFEPTLTLDNAGDLALAWRADNANTASTEPVMDAEFVYTVHFGMLQAYAAAGPASPRAAGLCEGTPPLCRPVWSAASLGTLTTSSPAVSGGNVFIAGAANGQWVLAAYAAHPRAAPASAANPAGQPGSGRPAGSSCPRRRSRSTLEGSSSARRRPASSRARASTPSTSRA